MSMTGTDHLMILLSPLTHLQWHFRLQVPDLPRMHFCAKMHEIHRWRMQDLSNADSGICGMHSLIYTILLFFSAARSGSPGSLSLSRLILLACMYTL